MCVCTCIMLVLLASSHALTLASECSMTSSLPCTVLILWWDTAFHTHTRAQNCTHTHTHTHTHTQNCTHTHTIYTKITTWVERGLLCTGIKGLTQHELLGQWPDWRVFLWQQLSVKESTEAKLLTVWQLPLVSSGPLNMSVTSNVDGKTAC